MAVEASTEGPSRSGAGTRRIGVVMNGVTGRMGTNQHLLRSIVAIREQGGVELAAGERIWPEPVLVGPRAEQLKELAEESGVERWTTDLDEALADPGWSLLRRAVPALRPAAVEGRSPPASTSTARSRSRPTSTARCGSRAARDAGVKHGVVQDKLFLPGLLKLADLVRDGFFGSILSVRGEFGYWVFPGPRPAAQRPSWNYRREDGGGIVVDMFCHWRYVLDNLFGAVRGDSRWAPPTSTSATRRTTATAEDAAYAQFELEGGVVVQLNSSWCTRVDRDELLELHVDGTEGSAVAGLHGCRSNPERGPPEGGLEPRSSERDPVPGRLEARCRWRVRQRVQGAMGAVPPARGRRPVRLRLEGAKGIQLAELGIRSWEERRTLRCRRSRRERRHRPARPAPGRRLAGPTPRATRPPTGARPRTRASSRRRARGRRPDRDPADPAVLDWDATLVLPAPSLVVRPRRGGRNGHRPAREAPGLAARARADRALGGRGAGRGGLLACGAGTDQLARRAASLAEIRDAYVEQCELIEAEGGSPVVLMASRELAAAASGPDDYRAVYDAVLERPRGP